MSKPDLQKAHQALQGLKTKPDVLDRFHNDLQAFGRGLGADIDPATLQYIVNTLLHQQAHGDHDPFGNEPGVAKLAHGFRIVASIKA